MLAAGNQGGTGRWAALGSFEPSQRRTSGGPGERVRPDGPSPLEEACPARTVPAPLARRGDARVHRVPLLAALAELPGDARCRQAAVRPGAPAARTEASPRAATCGVGHGPGCDTRGAAARVRRARRAPLHRQGHGTSWRRHHEQSPTNLGDGAGPQSSRRRNSAGGRARLPASTCAVRSAGPP
jgi:hypothetical protein